MPDFITLENQPANDRLDSYYAEMERLTNLGLNGRIDENTLRDEIERLTVLAILTMFLLSGGNPSNPEAQDILQEHYDQAASSAAMLASDIIDGRYSPNDDPEKGVVQTADEGMGKLVNRLVLWVFTAVGVYHAGQEFIPPRVGGDGELVEETLTWHVGNAEHCVDCLALDGVTLTVSEWNRTGIRPQSPSLACRGYNCQCTRTPDGLPSDTFAGVPI